MPPVLSLANDQAKVIQGRFQLLEKLGAGSFGEIFEAIDLKSKKRYAVKAESLHSKHPQLRLEFTIYRSLSRSDSFVHVYGFIQHNDHYIMIMDRLGKSLEQLFNYCNRRFSISTVCMIAIQILQRIQELHSKDYLHRDIKPDNFLIGDGPLNSTEAGKVYMIDLGLGKVWRENGRHIPSKTGKRLIGTPRYASINTHFGQEQSRRDDLESLGYMLMYFIRGRLPWQGLNGPTKEEKYHQIGQKKKNTDLRELCRGHPPEFMQFLQSTQQLAFTEEPPYQKYRDMFLNVLRRETDATNYRQTKFDWQKLSDVRTLSNKKNMKKIGRERRPQPRVQMNVRQMPNVNNVLLQQNRNLQLQQQLRTKQLTSPIAAQRRVCLNNQTNIYNVNVKNSQNINPYMTKNVANANALLNIVNNNNLNKNGVADKQFFTEMIPPLPKLPKLPKCNWAEINAMNMSPKNQIQNNQNQSPKNQNQNQNQNQNLQNLNFNQVFSNLKKYPFVNKQNMNHHNQSLSPNAKKRLQQNMTNHTIQAVPRHEYDKLLESYKKSSENEKKLLQQYENLRAKLVGLNKNYMEENKSLKLQIRQYRLSLQNKNKQCKEKDKQLQEMQSKCEVMQQQHRLHAQTIAQFQLKTQQQQQRRALSIKRSKPGSNVNVAAHAHNSMNANHNRFMIESVLINEPNSKRRKMTRSNIQPNPQSSPPQTSPPIQMHNARHSVNRYHHY